MPRPGVLQDAKKNAKALAMPTHADLETIFTFTG